MLTDEDKCMIIGCDVLWDVSTNQNAKDSARKRLQADNDTERCSKKLMKEILVCNTSDNVKFLTFCFQTYTPVKIKKGTRIAAIHLLGGRKA